MGSHSSQNFSLICELCSWDDCLISERLNDSVFHDSLQTIVLYILAGRSFFFLYSYIRDSISRLAVYHKCLLSVTDWSREEKSVSKRSLHKRLLFQCTVVLRLSPGFLECLQYAMQVLSTQSTHYLIPSQSGLSKLTNKIVFIL